MSAVDRRQPALCGVVVALGIRRHAVIRPPEHRLSPFDGGADHSVDARDLADPQVSLNAGDLLAVPPALRTELRTQVRHLGEHQREELRRVLPQVAAIGSVGENTFHQ